MLIQNACNLTMVGSDQDSMANKCHFMVRQLRLVVNGVAAVNLTAVHQSYWMPGTEYYSKA